MKFNFYFVTILILLSIMASSCNETSITALPEFYNIHEKLKPNEDYISSRHTYVEVYPEIAFEWCLMGV